MARPLTLTTLHNLEVDTAIFQSGTGSGLFPDGSGFNQPGISIDNSSRDLDVTGDWTIEMWLKKSTNPTNTTHYVFNSDRSSGSIDASFRVEIHLNSTDTTTNQNCIRFSTENVDSAGSRISTEVVWGTGQIGSNWFGTDWRHLAITNTNGTIRIHWDGVVKQTSTGNSYTDLIAEDGGFAIDPQIGYEETALQPYRGHMDEFRVSNSAKYGASTFTPQSRLQPLEDTLLLIHFDGADESTSFFDDIGVDSGTINLALTNGVSSEARLAEIIRPDGVTWDEIDTWNTWYVNDNWGAAQKFESSINLTATGAKLQLGSAELNLGAIGIATAENFAFAESQLDFTLDTNVRGGRILDGGRLFIDTGTWDETDTWDTFDPDQWEIPYGLAEMDVIASGGYLISGEAELNLATVKATAGERIVGGSAELNLATVQIVAGESVPPTQGEAQLGITLDLTATAEEFDRATAELNIVLASTVDANYAHFGSAQLPIDINLEADAQDFDRATAQIDMSMSITATPTRILSTVEAELPITLTQEVDVLNVKGGSANFDITLSAEQEARLFVGGTNTSNIELGVEAEADDFDNAASLLLTNIDLSAFAGIILESAEATLNLATIKISEAERIVGGSAELPISIDTDIFATEIPAVPQFTLPIEMATEVDGDLTLDGRATLNLASVKLTDANMFRGVSATLNINLETTADSGVNFVGSANLPLANILLSDAESRGPVLGSAILPLATIQLVDGELKLLDSDFTFKIYAETRLLTPKSETRIYKPYSETRTIEVDS
jgi:hypothetical protein